MEKIETLRCIFCKAPIEWRHGDWFHVVKTDFYGEFLYAQCRSTYAEPPIEALIRYERNKGSSNE